MSSIPARVLGLRNETAAERLDRHWASLLQELRVVQTGGQLPTGFLLTLPFAPRFDILDHSMKAVYLLTVSAAVLSTALLIALVAMHRLLFAAFWLVLPLTMRDGEQHPPDS